MQLNPAIPAHSPLPVVAPDIPVERRPAAPDQSQADSQNGRHGRGFQAAAEAQRLGLTRVRHRGAQTGRSLVEANLSVREDRRRAAPMGPSPAFLAQTLAQEVVPEHKYQQANAQGAGIRAYEDANDRIATVMGPVYPFDRAV